VYARIALPKPDDALQLIFISGHYFSQKCWQLGVGVKKIFRTQTS
jgi:hypothetical protein